MTAIIEQINTQQLADHLRELQSEFKHDDFIAYNRAKPLNVDFEVNKDEIVIGFDLSKDDAITVEIKTPYLYGDPTAASISFIEVDNVAGTYTLESDDTNALLVECKRIIHDAVHYKLVDDDSEPQPYDTMESLGFTNSDFLHA